MHVVFTGGTGWLGSKLVQAFLANNVEVTVLTRPTSDTSHLQSMDAGSRLDVQIIPPTGLPEQVFARGTDAVIHTAVDYGKSGTSNLDVKQANVSYPQSLVTLAEKKGVPLFINTDTYFSKMPSTIQGFTEYIKSKEEFRTWLESHETGLQVVSLQLEHIYGPGDTPRKLIPLALDAIVVKRISTFEATRGYQARDFVHVDDVVRAFLRVFFSKKTRNLPRFSSFEVGTGVANTVRKLLFDLKSLSGSNTYLDFGAKPYRHSELMYSCADQAFMDYYQWSPEVTLEQGLTHLVQQVPRL